MVFCCCFGLCAYVLCCRKRKQRDVKFVGSPMELEKGMVVNPLQLNSEFSPPSEHETSQELTPVKKTKTKEPKKKAVPNPTSDWTNPKPTGNK